MYCRNYVNLNQTNRVRRLKYGLMRAMCYTREESYKMRDWSLTAIARVVDSEE